MHPDEELLARANQEGGISKLKAFMKLSGPGWLQSAITLGGGSLAGALFLGVIGGYSMLWVQVLAMFFGVTMLCAISYVTLTIGRSPFRAIKEEINPVLAWGWLVATMAANLVWVLPQFALSYAAISQNLLPGQFVDATDTSKYVVSAIIFVIVVAITLCYGNKGVGIRIYEFILKIVVAGIVLCFMGVVIKLATSADDFHLGEVMMGFIPNFSLLFEPSQTMASLLDSISNEEVRGYWSEQIVIAQRERMVGAASAAVGINMTFLLPYSMLAKGWNKQFRGLAIFDLSTAMVIPFIIAVSCVVIASAYMFHGKAYEGLIDTETNIVDSSAKGYGAWEKIMAKRIGDGSSVSEITVDPAENRIAATLIARDTSAFADSLSTLTGDKEFSNLLFGLGVLAMGMSTISILMLISGFVLSEMFGVAHGGSLHKVGICLGGFGVFWPYFWTGDSKAYLAIVTSTIGYILLPIAFLTFFLMMNSKRLLGDNMPRGTARVIWNTLMGVALLVTGYAAGFTAIGKKMTIGEMKDVPVGTIGLVTFIIMVVIAQIYMMSKRKES